MKIIDAKNQKQKNKKRRIMTCFLRVRQLLHQVALALAYMYALATERTFNFEKREYASVT